MQRIKMRVAILAIITAALVIACGIWWINLILEVARRSS